MNYSPSSDGAFRVLNGEDQPKTLHQASLVGAESFRANK
jgi:hypothetical protein